MTETADRTNVLAGPMRVPRNAALNAKGSIHDDETAQRLGLRGGTVAGSVHLDLFPPLLLDVFGERWYERGSVSMNFKNPTVDQEPTRAFVARPVGTGDEQVRVWIEREDGMLVGEGTAAVGAPSEPTALRAIDHNRFAPAADEPPLRILAGIASGDEIPVTEVLVDGDRQRGMLERGLCTEPLGWYTGDSPWGGPIATPQTCVHHLYTFAANAIGRRARDNGGGGGVGLFGAIELEQRSGPLLLDESYAMSGRILGIGQSPRTEYVWFETVATDGGGSGTERAAMVMQLRWMKASSPLYTEA
jgi:hypothetical protein